MRTYGRLTNPDGTKRWVVVETADDGDNTEVWLTTLAQTLKLALGESPFFANYGIPAKQSIVQQVFPDFYVAQARQQFAGHFASLIIAKEQNPDPSAPPTYKLTVTTNQGVKRIHEVAT